MMNVNESYLSICQTTKDAVGKFREKALDKPLTEYQIGYAIYQKIKSEIYLR